MSILSVVLSGRGLCDGLITRPEESTEGVKSECDREARIMRRPWTRGGSCCAMVKKKTGSLVYSVSANFVKRARGQLVLVCVCVCVCVCVSV